MPVTPVSDSQFRTMVDPHRRALLAHCYRMMGSIQDAEDQLQETLLRAWRGLDRFEGRASPRTWLYRIATNSCLTALEARVSADMENCPWADMKMPTDGQ